MPLGYKMRIVHVRLSCIYFQRLSSPLPRPSPRLPSGAVSASDQSEMRNETRVTFRTHVGRFEAACFPPREILVCDRRLHP